MKLEIEALLAQPTISIDETACLLGTGRHATYRAARRGEFETMRVGGRIRVLTAPLRRRLGLETAANFEPEPDTAA
jgi:excisionase family DNA binding protein